MTAPGSVSGIASGIQWRDLIDQIQATEEARSVAPLTRAASAATSGAAAWGTYQSLVSKLGDAAKVLADGVVDNIAVSVGPSPSGRSLFSAAPSTDGSPGTYQVEVLATAKAHKLSGGTFASTSQALGLSGTLRLNGRPVTVAANASLADVRDAINTANTGPTRSGVAATILTIGPGQHRLLLTSEDTGSAGIELSDTGGVLAGLGVATTTVVANTGRTGDSRTFGFAARDEAIASLLDIDPPPAATTLTVGNISVAVDLANDSLDDLATRLTAAGVSSSVIEETAGTGTRHRLQISGVVSGDLSNADRRTTFELLGLVRRTFDAVAQVVTSEAGLDDATDADATAATALVDLRSGGASLGIVDGDVIQLRATAGNGTVSTSEVAVSAATTIADVRTALQTLYGAAATVTFESNGTFRIVDANGGESRLAAQLLIRTTSGEVRNFGRMATSTAGYAREVVAGTDAHMRVDGVDVIRRSNTIADAIDGTTITLTNASPGDTVRLDLSRDISSASGAAQRLAAAYNELVAHVKKVTASGGALPLNNSIRASLRTITQRLTGEVAGLTGVTRASNAGIVMDKNGVMSVDAAAFKKAVQDNLPGMRAFFGRTVTPPTGLSFLGNTPESGSGSFAVEITAPAAGPVATGSGFDGTYAAAGEADVMRITDSRSVETATIALTDGDDLDTILGKLNAAFVEKGMALSATASGGQIRITGSEVGSRAVFNVSYAGGSTGATQFGIAAGSYTGTNVVGTFNGVAGVGEGTQLTGATGTTAEGILLRHTTDAPLSGTLVHTLGLGDLVRNLATLVTREGDGLTSTQKASLERRVTTLNERATIVRERLERRREALVMQFTRMEGAMALLQSQASALSNSVAALQSSRK